MLNAGASLVLGSHPHRVQPIINTRKGSIVYSMGNFLFPERLIAPPKVTYYPDEPIDYASLPVTDEYPVVNQITLKTLPFLARVGLIVSSEIKEATVKSEGTLTYLNANNCKGLLFVYDYECCCVMLKMIMHIRCFLKCLSENIIFECK